MRNYCVNCWSNIAGGDVKTVWQKIHDKKSILEITEFFKVEYQMNNMLAVSPVPQVSFWDGIVMGGGVGISRLGEFRIATEKTMFAMPESGTVPSESVYTYMLSFSLACLLAYMSLKDDSLTPSQHIFA